MLSSMIAFKSTNLLRKLFIFSWAITNLFILDTLMRFNKLHGPKTSSSFSIVLREGIEFEVSALLMSVTVFFNM